MGSDEQRRCSKAGGDAYREGQRTGPPGKRGGVTLTRDRDLTTIKEFETCYIRRYEENTGPHHQKIRFKDRRRGGKARAKSKRLRVGIGLFLNSRLLASARLCELTKELVNEPKGKGNSFRQPVRFSLGNVSPPS